MKLFNFSLLIAGALAASDVTEWCNADLHAEYKTDDSLLKYVKQNKKIQTNPDKPRRPAHWRVIVRPECLNVARRQTKPGGYPEVKAAPLIKCTKKGPAGAKKIKPNGRRYKASKVLEWQDNMCS